MEFLTPEVSKHTTANGNKLGGLDITLSRRPSLLDTSVNNQNSSSSLPQLRPFAWNGSIAIQGKSAMKVHDIIERSVEWVAYDGVLGALNLLELLGFEPSTHPLPYLAVSPGRWRWSTPYPTPVNNGQSLGRDTRRSIELMWCRNRAVLPSAISSQVGRVN